MSQGVTSVVIADTTTATGYMNELITPAASPTPAMMNENSPICARLIPVWIECLNPLPVMKEPAVTAITFPVITITVRTSTASQCSTITLGSMSDPTETKKIATNMSRTGCTRRSIRTASPDSATRDPMMNAPSATEYPNV